MSEQSLEQLSYRKHIIQEIKGDENNTRMGLSLKACDIYGGTIKPYVETHLKSRFSESTVNQMAIVSSINITSKIVDIKGSVYLEKPEREFVDVSDAQIEVLETVYEDMNADAKLLQSNRMYELQNHNHIQIIPKDGKLSMRSLKNHQVNVIPSDVNPEQGEIYILSSYDKTTHRKSDGQNQNIADQDDWRAESERYIVWSPSYHFVMNGFGDLLTDEIINPIAPFIPIIEVAGDKDFEYWMNQNEGLSDFTCEYNGLLSSLGFQVDMQGHAQAYLKGDAELMPSPNQITVGISKILMLPTNSAANQDIEFGFISPNGDLAGSQSYAESILSMFLSSQNIDPKAISGNSSNSVSYSSGVERLLAMIEKFQGSKSVQHIYKGVEQKMFEVISAWLNLGNHKLLDKKYLTTQISTEAAVSIKYNRPESEISDKEKLEVIEKELELELITHVDAVAKYRQLSKEQAQEVLDEIQSQEDAPKMIEEDINVKN